MPLDPNIILGYKPTPIQTPFERANELEIIRARRAQNRLADFNYSADVGAAMHDQDVRNIYREGFSDPVAVKPRQSAPRVVKDDSPGTAAPLTGKNRKIGSRSGDLILIRGDGSKASDWKYLPRKKVNSVDGWEPAPGATPIIEKSVSAALPALGVESPVPPPPPGVPPPPPGVPPPPPAQPSRTDRMRQVSAKLLAAGYHSDAAALDKEIVAAEKAEQEKRKHELESGVKTFTQLSQTLGALAQGYDDEIVRGVPEPQARQNAQLQYEATVRALGAHNILDSSKIPPDLKAFDPNIFRTYASTLLTTAQQLERNNPNKPFFQNGIANKPYQEYEKSKARSGASQVIVNPSNDPFKNTMLLRKEYQDMPSIKSASEMQTAFKMIEAAYNRPSPANDLAMATKYMKILDPTSVVRESELAMAVNATGLIDRVYNYAEQIKSGVKLNPAQRKDFYESAKAINDSFQKEAQRTAGHFKEIASSYGLPEKEVTFGTDFEPVPARPGSAPAPAPKQTAKGMGLKLGDVYNNHKWMNGDGSNPSDWVELRPGDAGYVEKGAPAPAPADVSSEVVVPIRTTNPGPARPPYVPPEPEDRTKRQQELTKKYGGQVPPPVNEASKLGTLKDGWLQIKEDPRPAASWKFVGDSLNDIPVPRAASTYRNEPMPARPGSAPAPRRRASDAASMPESRDSGGVTISNLEGSPSVPPVTPSAGGLPEYLRLEQEAGAAYAAGDFKRGAALIDQSRDARASQKSAAPVTRAPSAPTPAGEPKWLGKVNELLDQVDALNKQKKFKEADLLLEKAKAIREGKPKPGTVLEGHVFLRGDPGVAKNWIRMRA